jgi:mono/diheme cytochrome c family protein
MMKNNTIWARATAAVAFGAVLALFAGLSGANDTPKWVAPASASTKKNPLGVSDASIQAGKKIYGKECVACHGKKGLGDGPKAADLTKEPGNLTTKDFQSQSDGAIYWKMSEGKKPMPAFKLAYSDEERWSIVNYLRTLHK